MDHALCYYQHLLSNNNGRKCICKELSLMPRQKCCFSGDVCSLEMSCSLVHIQNNSGCTWREREDFVLVIRCSRHFNDPWQDTYCWVLLFSLVATGVSRCWPETEKGKISPGKKNLRSGKEFGFTFWEWEWMNELTLTRGWRTRRRRRKIEEQYCFRDFGEIIHWDWQRYLV